MVVMFSARRLKPDAWDQFRSAWDPDEGLPPSFIFVENAERERKSLGIEPLPTNLSEAIRVAEDSELLAETLGEHVFDFFLRNKRAEWEDYRSQLTQFELDRYLPRL